jgi:hypothetical protein
MSLLDLGDTLKDAKEPMPVPKNEEYQLEILGVKVDFDKNDLKYLMPRLTVKNPPEGIKLVKTFTHFLYIPNDDLRNRDEERFERAKWDLREFLEAFSVDYSRPFDEEDDLVGKKGYAILGIRDDDFLGGEVNKITQLIRPK